MSELENRLATSQSDQAVQGTMLSCLPRLTGPEFNVIKGPLAQVLSRASFQFQMSCGLSLSAWCLDIYTLPEEKLSWHGL